MKSRRKSSTTNATVMPAAMPPSQKASRLSMGRGREIKSAVIPIRTGSIATNKRQDENCATHGRHLRANECRCANAKPVQLRMTHTSISFVQNRDAQPE